jgi:hypothetical protein
MTAVTIIERPKNPADPEEHAAEADVYVGDGTSHHDLILHLRHEGRDLRIVLTALAQKIEAELAKAGRIRHPNDLVRALVSCRVDATTWMAPPPHERAEEEP